MFHKNISPFLNDQFSQLFSSSELPHFLEHSKQSRPTTLLVNKNKINLNNLMGLLKRRGIITEKINDYLLLVKEENNLPIGATTEYLNGFYYIMGVSSAYAILSLKDQIGKMIFKNEPEISSDVTLASVQNIKTKKIGNKEHFDDQMKNIRSNEIRTSVQNTKIDKIGNKVHFDDQMDKSLNKNNIIINKASKEHELDRSIEISKEMEYDTICGQERAHIAPIESIHDKPQDNKEKQQSDPKNIKRVYSDRPSCETGTSGTQEIKKNQHSETSNQKPAIKKRKRLNKPVHLNVLDMCAAPGGKSILLNILLSEHIRQRDDQKVSFDIFCIDNDEKRSISLAANIIRMGMDNTVIIADNALKACGQQKNVDEKTGKTEIEMENIQSSKRSSSKNHLKGKKDAHIPNQNGYLPKMDLILLDAPCSGSGTLSKDIQAGNLDISTLHSLNALQRKLVLSGYDKLKGNGLLFYSTCSVLPEENEMIIQFLLESRKCAKIMEIDGIGRNGMKAFRGKHFNSNITMARRIYPHTHNGDGFFYCLIRKCN